MLTTWGERELAHMEFCRLTPRRHWETFWPAGGCDLDEVLSVRLTCLTLSFLFKRTRRVMWHLAQKERYWQLLLIVVLRARAAVSLSECGLKPFMTCWVWTKREKNMNRAAIPASLLLILIVCSFSRVICLVLSKANRSLVHKNPQPDPAAFLFFWKIEQSG